MSRTGLKRPSTSTSAKGSKGGSKSGGNIHNPSNTKKARSSSQAHAQAHSAGPKVPARIGKAALARHKGRDEAQRGEVDRQLRELKTRGVGQVAAERTQGGGAAARKVQPRERDELMRTFEGLMS